MVKRRRFDLVDGEVKTPNELTLMVLRLIQLILGLVPGGRWRWICVTQSRIASFVCNAQLETFQLSSLTCVPGCGDFTGMHVDILRYCSQ